MRFEFLGHVGFFIETEFGSVLCDPWFNPAYFGSWFPYPRNDDLDVTRFAHPDLLYISHLHHDHFDPKFLHDNVDRNTQVLLPEYPLPLLERELRELGFRHFIKTRHGETLDVDGLEVTILAMTSPADGPLGDSAMVVKDGTACLLNQNDARPGDPDELARLGPFGAQILQFSGAIWYPIAYDYAPEEMERLCLDKRRNQTERARQYIDWVRADHVFPCAGPPCFLDGDLFGFNDLQNSPTSIFPDQTVFLRELADRGINNAHLVVPGTAVELGAGVFTLDHPRSESLTLRPFDDKAAYLQEYQDDWSTWLVRERASWSQAAVRIVEPLRDWLEPVMEAAPITCSGIAGNVVLDTGDHDAVCLDFVEREVRPWAGDDYVYKVDVNRRLIESLIERHIEDWVNELFLSCRFVVHRPGNFNEYIMTFLKALSLERIAYVEECYRAVHERDETFERDRWEIECWCPHRQADLRRYGEIRDGVLTCSLHHWQFELSTGRCLTSDDLHLKCRPLAIDD